jgi:hypothetical protein
MSEAARSRRDDGRYEPQVAVPGREAAPFDPLAELARLVGQDDPFRNVFRPAAVPSGPVPQPTAPDPRQSRAEAQPRWAGEGVAHGEPPRHDGQGHGHEGHGYEDHGYDDRAYDDRAYDDRAYDAHAGADHGYDPQGHGDQDGPDHDRVARADPRYPQGAYDHPQAAAHPGYAESGVHHEQHGYAEPDDGYYAAEQAAYDQAGAADGYLDPAAAPSPLPDMWARGEAGVAPEVDHGQGPVSLDRPRSSARRPVAVLAAVLLLTAGGLGASFLAKGGAVSGGTSATAGRGAPTILAASGPTKVKVDDGSATAPEDQDAELLNKSANLTSGPVKIVSSQEQPADLAQLPKSDLADGARPLPPPSPSPFPEPKRVKTFVVHPDGSMLSGDAAPASSSVAAPAPSTGGDAPAALPATPKTAARGGTTPRVAAAASPAAEPTIASLSGDPASTDPAAVATTSAKPPRAAPATGGSYGVQLASSPVEADANAAFAKLKKRYPSLLGGLTATVHKAETGDKPVYRVRVGGMTQDEAKALCTQLQTAGGACLVMHN